MEEMLGEMWEFRKEVDKGIIALKKFFFSPDLSLFLFFYELE